MDALHDIGAHAPGASTPTSDEAPAVGAAQGFKGQGAADCLIFEQRDADCKRLAARRGGAA
jgi:hypothetical protein